MSEDQLGSIVVCHTWQDVLHIHRAYTLLLSYFSMLLCC